MLRRGRAAGAALVILGLVTVASADPIADPVEKAKAAVAASDYLTARTALDEAVATGQLSPAQLAESYRLRGIVDGALGDSQAATAAFQRCLALTPRAELPPGTSPKITRPFAAAQDYWKAAREPLRIKSETVAQPPSVTVRVTSDPLEMIAKLRVVVIADGGEEQLLEQAAGERVTFELPVGRRLDLRIAAVDAQGNRLAELGTKDVPIVIIGAGKPPPEDKVVVTPKPVAPATPRGERAVIWKWWLWGGTAVLVAGAATYFGYDALQAKHELDELNANSLTHTFDEATAVEDRAHRSVLVANIGYGVAGALAITATILWLTEPDAPRASREQRISVVPVAGGGALTFGGHF